MTDESINALMDEFAKRMRLAELTDEERDIIKSYIVSGETELNGHALDLAVDYTKDAIGKELLYNYVFYSRSDCRDKFEGAYRSMLITHRNRALTGRCILIEEGSGNA